MSSRHPLILGHRGLSARHLENSLEAFRAALAAGMDGLELDVQPTADGVAMVLHDDTLERTALGSGALRRLRMAELPLLKNGEAIPSLSEVLELPAAHFNVELKGEPGWQAALAAVEAAECLDRVRFSSFEHTEVLQLWAACPAARCGFLWEIDEADELTADDLESLPTALSLHIPLASAKARPAFWAPFADRIYLWDLARPTEAEGLGFTPAALIVDQP